jgi:hypothetical protein
VSGRSAFKAASHRRSGSRSPAFASSMIFLATASRVGLTMSSVCNGHLERDAHETGGLRVEPMAVQVWRDRHDSAQAR